MTITDHYRSERDRCETVDERRFVFRQYARAVIDEFLERRKREGDETLLSEWTWTWRKAAVDSHLPVRYPGCWAPLPRAELQELWTALERDRVGGRIG